MAAEFLIEADLHVHTVASGHAYSTLTEIARVAASRGLKAFAMTDHGPAMGGGPHRFHFSNLRILPKMIEDVQVFRGAELNILNEGGEVDLPTALLARLDLVWAGLHVNCYDGSGRASYTRAVINALENPYIDGIVHPGNPEFPLDVEAVVKQASKHNKLIEINNSSYHVRPGSMEICRQFATLSVEYGAMVAVNSDCHFADDVGRYDNVTEMLNEANLYRDLIINSSLAKVENYINRRKQRIANI